MSRSDSIPPPSSVLGASPAGVTQAPRYPEAILATCPLPWRDDGGLDEALFRRTVRHASELTRRLYIFGTAGEGYAVTDPRFREVTTIFLDEARRVGVTPMVGVISLSQETIVERIEWAAGNGVEEFQLSLPSWGALNDVEVDRFFADTCGRFPGVRFLHYNLARSKRLLTGSDYARLAARHPNLVAVKMGGEDEAVLAEVAAGAPELRCFFTEFGYLKLRQRTGCGLLCALGSCDHALARALVRADSGARGAIELRLRAIHGAAKAAIAEGAHMDGAYDKMYVKLHFPDFPLRLLAPYAGAPEARFAAFRDALAAVNRFSS